MNLVTLFQDYTFLTVAQGSALLGLLSGILACLAVLNKQALIGDGISHAALPGLLIGFMLIGTKQIVPMLLGALASGLLSVFFVMLITRFTKIKFDAALAVSFSVFFGFGLVLKTYIQKSPNASQAGLDHFLYGQASSLLQSDVRMMGMATLFCLAVVLLLWQQIKISMFDKDFAKSVGIPVQAVHAVITLLIAIAIVVGIQSVGVVLMSAMVVAPAVAARQWTSRYWLMMLLSAVFGCFAGVCGTLASSLYQDIPTGASIVLVISLVALFSLLFAPERGIVQKSIRRAKMRKAIREGNYVQS
ncbi:MAG: metal ABC transporter permease [Eubacteriales bacterium]|nr:metal ABC transporter permease [Eubacteriales bacterium]